MGCGSYETICAGDDGNTYNCRQYGCDIEPGSVQVGDCDNKARIGFPNLPSNKDAVGLRPWMSHGFVEAWHENGYLKGAIHWPNRWWHYVDIGFTACVKGPD